jgi:hypothetical protein
MIDNARQTLLVTALAGATVAAFNEILGEMTKELKFFAGNDFDRRFRALEARTLRSIRNAAFDGVSEQDQLFLADQMKRIIAAAFTDARSRRP